VAVTKSYANLLRLILVTMIKSKIIKILLKIKKPIIEKRSDGFIFCLSTTLIADVLSGLYFEYEKTTI